MQKNDNKSFDYPRKKRKRKKNNPLKVDEDTKKKIFSILEEE